MPMTLPQVYILISACTIPNTSIALHYKELNVHKVGALLVTPALSAVNDLKDYGVNACPLPC